MQGPNCFSSGCSSAVRGCHLWRLVNNHLCGALRIPTLLLFLSFMDVLIQPAGVTRQAFSKLVWAFYFSGEWKKHPIDIALGTEEPISKCMSIVSSFFPGSMSSAVVGILVQIYAAYLPWVIYAFDTAWFWVFENWCCWEGKHNSWHMGKELWTTLNLTVMFLGSLQI